MNIRSTLSAGSKALILLTSGLTFGMALAANTASLPKCLYISSYHSGYAWSDGVEEGVRSVLSGKCEVRQLDMDTKRKRSPADFERAVSEAISMIDSWKPDVVITSDDNAAKHLIVPHYKNKSLPFVFSGVNWTAEEYGFPYSNVTGIVEVAPIEPMLKEAIKVSGGMKGVYLGADTLTERKNYSRIEAGASRLNSSLEQQLVSDADAWKKAFEEANAKADYIVIGSSSGIDGWSDKEMGAYAAANAKIISVTNHRWMMPVTALGYTKIPNEHGEWAASTALEILAGTSPSELPIVTNRKWDLWINQGVLNSTGKSLSSRFTRRAKRFAGLED